MKRSRTTRLVLHLLLPMNRGALSCDAAVLWFTHRRRQSRTLKRTSYLREMESFSGFYSTAIRTADSLQMQSIRSPNQPTPASPRPGESAESIGADISRFFPTPTRVTGVYCETAPA